MSLKIGEVVGYVHRGCFAELDGRAVLNGRKPPKANDATTPDFCRQSCETENPQWIFFGVEAGGWCYCAASITTIEGNAAPLAPEQCSMGCTGDLNLRCGAQMKINVYEKLPRVTTVTRVPPVVTKTETGTGTTVTPPAETVTHTAPTETWTAPIETRTSQPETRASSTITVPSDQPTKSSPKDPESTSSKSEPPPPVLSQGGIAGIAVGAALVVIAASVGVTLLVLRQRRRRRRKARQSAEVQVGGRTYSMSDDGAKTHAPVTITPSWPQEAPSDSSMERSYQPFSELSGRGAPRAAAELGDGGWER